MDARVAGVIAGGLAVRGGGRVVAAGTGSGADVRAYGAYLLLGAAGGGAVGRLTVDASWLDASGAEGGVACLGGSLASARFAAPAGGAFGAGGVMDAGGVTASHVVIEPESATVPVGEADTPSGEPSADVDPTIGGASAEQAKHPTVKPAVATKTTTTTTVTKTTAAKASNTKSATATSSSLPKTADSHWIAVSAVLFVLGTALLGIAYRC